jgi:dephospho-CoA kinase
MNDDFLVFAITGGLATGKTTAAKFIQNLGYPVVFTDDIAKVLMIENNEIKDKIIKKFGSKAYHNDGSLNAAFISELVFADESDDNLQALNQIVHPYVIDEMMLQIESLSEKGDKIIFVESALIYEAELNDGFDYIITVVCSEANQIKRAMARGNLSEKQAIARISKQISLKDKAAWSDFVLNNDNSIDGLENSIRFLLPIWESLKPKQE